MRIENDKNDQTGTDDFIRKMETDGYCVFENIVGDQMLDRLRKAIDNAFESDRAELERGRFKADGYTSDVSRLMLGRDPVFTELLESSPLQERIDGILGDTCVLNNYSAVRLMPGVRNVVSNIHRDSPRFSPQFKLSIQILYFIDDFSDETGGTWVLPGGHLSNEKPSEDRFFKEARQITGKAGSAMVFDSMLWHAGGQNRSEQPRRGLAIVYTRSFMKQQIDIVRALPPSVLATLSDNLKRLVGYNVRVPASLDEFYLPDEARMYKANQG